MARAQKLDTEVIRRIISCPQCHAVLLEREESFLCMSGHGPFQIDSDGRWQFLPDSDAEKYHEEHESGINRLKSFLKRYPRFYYALWYILCPVWLSGRRPQSVKKYLSPDAVALNLGSGPRRIGKEFINVDVVPFEEVDVVADAMSLPFKDGSFDAVVHESLLEHVSYPQNAVEEIMRVLKPGGIMYASIPFLTPYHASPDDFNRWTRSGLRSLFSDFEVIEEGVDAGPWSAFLVFLSYWLGIIFAFGSKKAAPFLAFLFMCVLGPLKVFDYFFARIPGSDAVAAQLYFIGRKK